MSDEQEKKPTPRFASVQEQRKTVEFGTIGGKKEDTERPGTQSLGRSDVQTTKPLRKRQTVYLYEDLLRRLKHRIADTGEEISDVANKAIREFLDKEESKKPE